MGREEVDRYIEAEVPDMGLIENRTSAVECFRPDCEKTIELDPSTYVVEDPDAVELISEVLDNPGDPTAEADAKQVEIYCSPDCRNNRYSNNE